MGNRINTIEEFKKLTKCNMAIYGAGVVAHALLRYCLNSEVLGSIKKIIVSRKESFHNELFHIPIVEINEITDNDNCVYLIATKERLHNEIANELLVHHISNIFYLMDGLADQLIEGSYTVSDSVIQMLPRKAIKFEVHIAEHCNLNCRGCYHFSPLAQKEFLQLSTYEKDCKRLSELYNGMASQILLLGGEPLLHPDIATFLRITRECFKNATIKVVTNGILLSSMNDSFWNMCKNNDITIAPTKYPVEIDYCGIEKAAERFGVTISYFNNSQIEKTLEYTPIDLGGNQDKEANFTNCYRANECITLRNGRLYTCIIPAHIHHFAKFFNLNLPDFETDGIDIYGATDADEISDFLTKPIEACKYCDRKNCVKGIKWGRSSKNISEWT